MIGIMLDVMDEEEAAADAEDSEMAAAPIRKVFQRRRVRLLNSSLLEAVNQLLPSLLNAPGGN